MVPKQSKGINRPEGYEFDIVYYPFEVLQTAFWTKHHKNVAVINNNIDSPGNQLFYLILAIVYQATVVFQDLLKRCSDNRIC